MTIPIALQNPDPEPSPVDAMPLDQAVAVQLHRLEEIHLFGGAVVPAIRPEQAPALMAIFGLGFTAVYVVFVLMFLNAYGLRESLKLNTFETVDTRASILLYGALAATGVIATLIAMLLPAPRAGLAGWT